MTAHCTSLASAVCRQRRIAVRRRTQGSVLLLVLVVVAVLTLGTGAYLELMQTEHRAVRRHGRALQAARLAESGVEYLKAILALSPAAIQAKGGLVSNSTNMQALLGDDQADDFSRGRFTLVAPAQVNGIYNGIRYGVENESGKLNLNVLLAEGDELNARNRLMVLPGMTLQVADAILDWLDADAAPREFGAEEPYYSQLSPPCLPRNGPIGGLDELLLVRGVTPELLYGLDQNRNLLLDVNEQPRGALLEIDNADGSMNRGWAAFLTTASVENLGGTAAAPRVDLNGPDLQTLYSTLATALTDEQARFIVLYRQYGGSGGQQPGAQVPGGAQGASQAGGAGQTGQAGGAGRAGVAGAANRADGGQQAGNAVPISSVELNMQQQASAQIATLLDLVGAQVTITPPNSGGQQGGGQGPQNGPDGGGGQGQQGGGGGGGRQGNDGGGQGGGGQGGRGQGGGGQGGRGQGGGGQGGGGQGGGGQGRGQGGAGGNQGQGGGQQNQNGNDEPPKIVESPWRNDLQGYRDLLKLYDVASAGTGPVAGRVNLNAASRTVLLSIPNLTPAIVDQIVLRRELEPDPTLSSQRHALWLLVDGILSVDQFRQVERYVTAAGDAFSGQSIGFFDAGAPAVRGEFLVDRIGPTPKTRAWRDLSAWGPGFTADQLGVATTNGGLPVTAAR